jgi:hypothetical protein
VAARRPKVDAGLRRHHFGAAPQCSAACGAADLLRGASRGAARTFFLVVREPGRKRAVSNYPKRRPYREVPKTRWSRSGNRGAMGEGDSVERACSTRGVRVPARPAALRYAGRSQHLLGLAVRVSSPLTRRVFARSANTQGGRGPPRRVKGALKCPRRHLPEAPEAAVFLVPWIPYSSVFVSFVFFVACRFVVPFGRCWFWLSAPGRAV